MANMLDIKFTTLDEGKEKLANLLIIETPTILHAKAILQLRNDLLEAGADEVLISLALDLWIRKINRDSWEQFGWRMF